MDDPDSPYATQSASIIAFTDFVSDSLIRSDYVDSQDGDLSIQSALQYLMDIYQGASTSQKDILITSVQAAAQG